MPDRIATSLLRIARDPISGRVRRGGTVDIGLRAGLFADLALAGGVLTEDGAPATTYTGPTGDHYLDALRRAVDGRPGVAWPRWFRHVHADRDALVRELVEQGRWHKRGGLRPAYDDDDRDGAVALGVHIASVAAHRDEPRDAPEAILTALCVICGAAGEHPKPRAMRDELRPLLDELGVDGDPIRLTVQHTLFSAASTVRRYRRGGGPSKRPIR